MTFDASGCSVNQVLYFIDKGIPAAAIMPDGSCLLLYGYDQYNVSIYDPVTQRPINGIRGCKCHIFPVLIMDFYAV